MAADRTRLQTPTRLALLENFETRTEAWREDVDEKMDDLLVLKTKVGMYAALGSFAGGAVVAIVASIVALVLH